mgnify:CR=1 FL=1
MSKMFLYLSSCRLKLRKWVVNALSFQRLTHIYTKMQHWFRILIMISWSLPPAITLLSFSFPASRHYKKIYVQPLLVPLAIHCYQPNLPVLVWFDERKTISPTSIHKCSICTVRKQARLHHFITSIQDWW